ncbi:TrmH family RNA methyltransferase [Edaphobacter albus]|uniref:TrmH family RNA methyltransferase n=1 Tax=Edaphobacter sp. 4G125 TaxID=2763071 RepID=UPI001643FF81|nr:RNA methyltransferase [Edaphobacter sp. 4G125]QNI38075.1 RNA methyltransferase [Edaphobacter sp. 4G125]
MAVTATVITSRTNPRVKQLRAAFTGSDRLSEGLIAIEGHHLLEEAIRSGITPKTIFLIERQKITIVPPATAEVLHLSSDVFASAVETRSPQGIAALIEPPAYSLENLLDRQISPLFVITAGLQDPGNLGTIVRSAEAFGATGVLTTPGTVSPWNQKALRASAGSIFRVPVVSATEEEIAALQTAHSLRLFAAVSAAHDEGVLSANATDLRQPCAILIGNEGAGLAPEWLAMSTARITIPCPGPVESLNAAIAASLLLYEASRQRSSAAPSATETIPGPLRRRPTGATR